MVLAVAVGDVNFLRIGTVLIMISPDVDYCISGEKKGRTVTIYVDDNGHGMDEQGVSECARRAKLHTTNRPFLAAGTITARAPELNSR